MTVYTSSDQLYRNLKTLFTELQQQDPRATHSVSAARLIIKLRVSEPTAEILINGRLNPVQIAYGPSGLRADLDLQVPAEVLHAILLAQLSLKEALASGTLKVRGPIFKVLVLEDVFRRGQAIYPQVVQQNGLDGRHTD